MNAGKSNDDVDNLLVSLKIAVADGSAAGATFSRDLYEHAALYSLQQLDTDAFERHFALAKCAYSDSDASLKPSALWSTIEALYLMHLLVQNRLAEFHSELELLPESLKASPQVAFPVELEQFLAEGRYNKVLDATRALPDPKFRSFVDPLVDAVRGEIAACSSASYTTLPLATAQQMMYFDSEQDLLTYISDSQPAWTVDRGVISFNADTAPAARVPSVKLITNTLAYATELERIV